MRILFVMDPLEKCNARWDNSLYLLREFFRREHETWIADSRHLRKKGRTVIGKTQNVTLRRFHGRFQRQDYKIQVQKIQDLQRFDLILIRKDPPVDSHYLKFLFLLETIAGRVPIVNHPRGLRNVNEKLSILNFPKWIPETLVTSSVDAALSFQKKLRAPVVIKPLDNKGGKGVFKLVHADPRNISRLRRATAHEQKPVMVQKYLPPGKAGEKRVMLLNGEFLTAYEKRPKRGEFRANLSLGGTFHPASLTKKEKQLAADLKPHLLKHGLYFAGIDTLNEKLLEINVTSPAGITEAKCLYPKLALVEAWADFLEDFVRRF